MTGLNMALAECPPGAPLWCARGCWRTAEQIRGAAAQLADQICAERVAFAFADDESLAVGILAAEQRCRALLLVPRSWDQAALDRYLIRAQIDYLVTNRSDLTASHILRPDFRFDASADLRPGAARDLAWLIPTSGTTGQPKLVEHRLSALARTVKTNPAKGVGFIWGLSYELARFAGLQVFLQAILGRSRLIFIDLAAGAEAGVAELSAGGCNAISATPTLWRRLLMAPNVASLPLRLVTLGGEIADQPLLSALARRFPGAKIQHIYASTEAGVGFSVADGRAGFPAAFLDAPLPGIELKLDEQGSLWLRASSAAPRFVGEVQPLSEDDGWVNSGDQVGRKESRCFFLGRANGAINVGGNKVHPEEIEASIRAIEGVRQVRVRAKANPIVGSLVEALVQPEVGADRPQLKRAILAGCRGALAAHKVPALVTWVEELTANAAGKLART